MSLDFHTGNGFLVFDNKRFDDVTLDRIYNNMSMALTFVDS